MISATLRIWGSEQVESAGTSWPSSERFSEALKVANRSVSRATAGGAATANSATATRKARLSMSAPYAPGAAECEDSVGGTLLGAGTAALRDVRRVGGP